MKGGADQCGAQQGRDGDLFKVVMQTSGRLNRRHASEMHRRDAQAEAGFAIAVGNEVEREPGRAWIDRDAAQPALEEGQGGDDVIVRPVVGRRIGRTKTERQPVPIEHRT